MTFADLNVGDEFYFTPDVGNTYRKIGHDRYQLVSTTHDLVPGLTYQSIHNSREVARS